MRQIAKQLAAFAKKGGCQLLTRRSVELVGLLTMLPIQEWFYTEDGYNDNLGRKIYFIDIAAYGIVVHVDGDDVTIAMDDEEYWFVLRGSEAVQLNLYLLDVHTLKDWDYVFGLFEGISWRDGDYEEEHRIERAINHRISKEKHFRPGADCVDKIYNCWRKSYG